MASDARQSVVKVFFIFLLFNFFCKTPDPLLRLYYGAMMLLLACGYAIMNKSFSRQKKATGKNQRLYGSGATTHIFSLFKTGRHSAS